MTSQQTRVRVLTGPQVVVFADNAQYIAVVVQTLEFVSNSMRPMYILTESAPAIGTEVYAAYYQGHTKELVYL